MMKTEIFNLKEILNKNQVNGFYSYLNKKIYQDSLIIYPTETIYGIGGRCTEKVKEKIYAIKKKNRENNLIIVAGHINAFTSLSLVFNVYAQTLANAFWPGNLTMILRYSHSDTKIAIRVSDHPFLTILARFFKDPIFSTSANLSGTDYRNDPEFIFNTFNKKAEIIVDYGVLPESLPSTVVDVADGKQVRIIREGTISADKIIKTLKEPFKTNTL